MIPTLIFQSFLVLSVVLIGGWVGIDLWRDVRGWWIRRQSLRLVGLYKREERK